MSVSNGQIANQTTFNNAFVSRTAISTDTASIFALNNAQAISGTALVNAQREFNAESSFSGMPLNSAKNVKPSWTSTAVGTNVDDLRVRAEALTAKAGLLQVQVDKATIWRKFTVPFGSFTAAGLTEDIELFEMPAQTILHAAVIKNTTAFGGGSLSAYGLSIGLAGALDCFTETFDVFQAPGDTIFDSGSFFELKNFGSITSLRLAAIAVGDNLINATAGSVDVWLKTSLLP